jgi:hypothetical protein
MDRAVARLPEDPALALERGMAAAGRFAIMVDTGTARPVLARNAMSGLFLPESFRARDTSANDAAAMLERLAGDPIVGPEARARLGLLHFILGNDQEARTAFTAAAAQATDSDVRYLALFLLGWSAIGREDADAAKHALDASLAARPGSQSAAVLRAALALQDGEAEAADAAGAAALERKGDLDPWRLILYGHYQRLRALVASLRAEVAK